MSVDLYCSQLHYARHAAPFMCALPDDVRGKCYLGLHFNELHDGVIRMGLIPERGRPPASPDPVLIASGPDLPNTNGRPTIYVEHGAGQTYASTYADNQGYTGGRGRDQIRVYLCPNVDVAEKNLAAYPTARAYPVGDPTIRPRVPRLAVAGERSVIAVTFHFDLPGLGVPETRESFTYWSQAILGLREDYQIIGHAHPKIRQKVLPFWDNAGIMSTEDLDIVMQCADLLIVDNSSVGAEFARTGRPILWLNAPWYRRNVDHGNRFWSWTQWAECCDSIDDLPNAVARALADHPTMMAAREIATAKIYPFIGDEAAHLGAQAILAFMGRA